VSPEELADRARQVVADLDAPVPLPGGGATALRLRALAAVARDDLAVARLVEPHLDALAILAEAGRPEPPPGRLLAVWASEPAAPVELRAAPDGTGAVLRGTKPFCSGAATVDAALVTVRDAAHDRPLLVHVDLTAGRRAGTVTLDGSTWRTPAFAATTTATVTFAGHPVADGALVGEPGWYLDRPGFWHGALAPAAVWVGGAQGLLDVAERLGAASVHQQVGLGEMRALQWAMFAELQAAADEADRDPDDTDAARRRALVVRHLVERQCTRMIDLFATAHGPRPLAFDEQVITRVQELQLYVRQVHPGADLAELGTPRTEPAP